MNEQPQLDYRHPDPGIADSDPDHGSVNRPIARPGPPRQQTLSFFGVNSVKTAPLIQIENRLTAIEVTIRTLSRADERQAHVLELHTKGILANIASTLHSIRAELTEIIYATAHLEREEI